jgi:maltose O-acetyltransferase
MTERSEKQKMLAGDPYNASDPEIAADQQAAAEWMQRFNQTSSAEEREALLRKRLGSVGDGSTVRPPFHCDYGSNIHLGAGVS